jgi:hypothetical protein
VLSQPVEIVKLFRYYGLDEEKNLLKNHLLFEFLCEPHICPQAPQDPAVSATLCSEDPLPVH